MHGDWSGFILVAILIIIVIVVLILFATSRNNNNKTDTKWSYVPPPSSVDTASPAAGNANNIPCKQQIEQARLWDDHFELTRATIIAAKEKSPCFDTLKTALYANQKALGDNFAAQLRSLSNARKAGDRLTRELTVHIDQALAIVTAASQGKPTDALVAAWRKNGKDVARVYNDYMPGLVPSTTEQMMDMHLTTTLNEAVAILTGTCGQSIATGKAALDHIRMMSDYLNGMPMPSTH